MKANKGFAHIFLLIIVVSVGIIGIGYFAYKNGQIKIPSQQMTSIYSGQKSNSVDKWDTYSSIGFSFEYPSYDYPDRWPLFEKYYEKEKITTVYSPLSTTIAFFQVSLQSFNLNKNNSLYTEQAKKNEDSVMFSTSGYANYNPKYLGVENKSSNTIDWTIYAYSFDQNQDNFAFDKYYAAYAIKNNKTIRISLFLRPEENKEIFYRILSSFKLLDNSQLIFSGDSYTFKYPNYWQQNKTEDGYTYFIACNNMVIHIATFRSASLDEIVKQDPYFIGTPKNTTLDSRAAKYFEYIGDPGSTNSFAKIISFTGKDNEIIAIRFYDGCYNDFQKAVTAEFKPLLSSFKFSK